MFSLQKTIFYILNGFFFTKMRCTEKFSLLHKKERIDKTDIESKAFFRFLKNRAGQLTSINFSFIKFCGKQNPESPKTEHTQPNHQRYTIKQPKYPINTNQRKPLIETSRWSCKPKSTQIYTQAT